MVFYWILVIAETLQGVKWDPFVVVVIQYADERSFLVMRLLYVFCRGSIKSCGISWVIVNQNILNNKIETNILSVRVYPHDVKQSIKNCH